ncbi:MAG: TetR/AcrR family transcriptional regulator [Frankiales bacterium]|jgi:AcrR family transcriptional regulator|nr:TetR/AcrR family transcriptional regulator [Frankiales bacterium]
MGRTRTGILEATGRAVEKYGVRRATMGDVASVAGIAKGTLYNHFRTKGDLLTAAVAAGVDALADDCVALAQGRGEQGLTRALRHAAETLSAHPALVRVAAEEPAELVRLLQPGYDGAWPAARAAIARVMVAAGPVPAAAEEGFGSAELGSAVGSAMGDQPAPAGEISADAAVVETILRWLVTFAGAPGVPGETAAGAALLARTLTGDQPAISPGRAGSPDTSS